jgi:hypothetical protein
MSQLNLQNIAVNYNLMSCTSLFGNKFYQIEWFEELNELKKEFESAFKLNVEEASVLLTADQYGSVGELIVTAHKVEKTIGGVTGETIECKHTLMVTVATEHPELMTKLQEARLLIEAQIQNQINS